MFVVIYNQGSNNWITPKRWQLDSYESVKSTSPTVYNTMDEMLDWGATNLHINYCMWNYQATADPVGSNDWADALVAIATSPTFGPT